MKKELEIKTHFFNVLSEFVSSLNKEITTEDGQWTIKGFIDVFKNIYTISSDTKIVSKILEIHIFPKILKFAEDNKFKIVLADHQNYYPDISFIYRKFTLPKLTKSLIILAKVSFLGFLCSN